MKTSEDRRSNVVQFCRVTVALETGEEVALQEEFVQELESDEVYLMLLYMRHLSVKSGSEFKDSLGVRGRYPLQKASR